jgi:RNA polymerase sigma-70 factor (ECF subfamily)
MLTLTDEELVTRCKAELPSNTRSYEILVQRHMNRVYSLVFRVVSNKEEAEDITQEVFVKVYNNLRKFEQQASFSSWLYRIATNSALDSLDKIKRRPMTVASSNNSAGNEEENYPLSSQPSPLAGPEESVIQSELRDCIRQVLKKLDRDQAHVLLLRDFDDLSYDEIAKVLQASLSTVKMRIHRARLAFQEVFNQFCGRYLDFSFSTSYSSKEKAKKV